MQDQNDDGLVSHVAKAIYESYCNAHVMSPLGMLIDLPEWDDLGNDVRRVAIQDANAAIAAMNEYLDRIDWLQLDENAMISPGKDAKSVD